MRQLTLAEPVTIRGPDIWGRSSLLSLTPILSGWQWNLGEQQIPITKDLLRYRHRRLVLEGEGARLNMFEHIGFLRTLGLDGVLITCPSGWPPYDGRARQLWEAVWPHIVEGAKLMPLEPARPAVAHVPGNPSRNIVYAYSSSDALRISVTVRYEGFPSYRCMKTVSLEGAEEIVRARPLGQPQMLRSFFSLAATCGWPHYDSQLWPRGRFTEKVLQELARHRVLDLMGALGFLMPPGYCLAGHIDSTLANHEADVALVKSARMVPVLERTPVAA